MALAIEFTRKVWHFYKTIVHLQSNFALSDWNTLRYGVMVALQILALSVRVQILLSQQIIPYYGNGGIAQLVRAYDS